MMPAGSRWATVRWTLKNCCDSGLLGRLPEIGDNVRVVAVTVGFEIAEDAPPALGGCPHEPHNVGFACLRMLRYRTAAGPSTVAPRSQAHQAQAPSPSQGGDRYVLAMMHRSRFRNR
jgi:hypothetical protein